MGVEACSLGFLMPTLLYYLLKQRQIPLSARTSPAAPNDPHILCTAQSCAPFPNGTYNTNSDFFSLGHPPSYSATESMVRL